MLHADIDAVGDAQANRLVDNSDGIGKGGAAGESQIIHVDINGLLDLHDALSLKLRNGNERGKAMAADGEMLHRVIRTHDIDGGCDVVSAGPQTHLAYTSKHH